MNWTHETRIWSLLITNQGQLYVYKNITLIIKSFIYISYITTILSQVNMDVGVFGFFFLFFCGRSITLPPPQIIVSAQGVWNIFALYWCNCHITSTRCMRGGRTDGQSNQGQPGCACVEVVCVVSHPLTTSMHVFQVRARAWTAAATLCARIIACA